MESVLFSEIQSRLAFIDLLKGVLNFDPVQRWTPAQVWIRYLAIFCTKTHHLRIIYKLFILSKTDFCNLAATGANCLLVHSIADPLLWCK